MKGYNLPDNVSPNDPEAPWNKEEQLSNFLCEICGVPITEETGCDHRLAPGRDDET